MKRLNLITMLALCVFAHGHPRCVFSEYRATVNCRGENWSHIPYHYLQEKSFKTLDLGVNNITSLENTSRFSELKTKDQIEAILLDHNQISDLPRGLFNSLTNLQFLDLSNNNLKHIHRRFCHMTQLRELVLDGNPIESISRNAFRCLRNLRKLSLTNTKLRKLPEGFLENLLVQEVNLSGNGFEDVFEAEDFFPRLNISLSLKPEVERNSESR